MSKFVDEINTRAQELARRNKLSDVGSVEQVLHDGKQTIVATLADQSSFRTEASEFVDVEQAAAPVSRAFTVLQEFVARSVPIGRNTNLSPSGKVAELRPAQELAVAQAAVEFEALQDFSASIATAETQRYAPPEYPYKEGPNYFQKALADDREVRDLLRKMTVEEQMTVLKQVEAGDAEERVLRAILGSPLGLGEGLVRAASAAHRRRIDELDPVGRVKLDRDSQALDWAQRATFVIAAHLKVKTELTDEQLADIVHVRRGWPVFGIDNRAVALAKHRAERQKFAQKAA